MNDDASSGEALYRLVGTYRAEPRAGQLGMTIGIRDHTDPEEVARLRGMLLLPFRGKIRDYAINSRGSDKASSRQPSRSDVPASH